MIPYSVIARATATLTTIVREVWFASMMQTTFWDRDWYLAAPTQQDTTRFCHQWNIASSVKTQCRLLRTRKITTLLIPYSVIARATASLTTIVREVWFAPLLLPQVG